MSPPKDLILKNTRDIAAIQAELLALKGSMGIGDMSGPSCIEDIDLLRETTRAFDEVVDTDVTPENAEEMLQHFLDQVESLEGRALAFAAEAGSQVCIQIPEDVSELEEEGPLFDVEGMVFEGGILRLEGLPQFTNLYANFQSELAFQLAQAGPAPVVAANKKDMEISDKIFSAFLAFFGLKGLKEILLAEFETLIAALQLNIKNKAWREVGRTVKVMLKKLASSGLWKEVAKKLGAKKVGEAWAKVLGKFVPFIGWALVIIGLIGAIRTLVC